MADTVLVNVLKTDGWKEVATGVTTGFFTVNDECLFAMAAITPTLSYGHRANESDRITFNKSGSDKLFVKSDQSDHIIVVVTPS